MTTCLIVDDASTVRRAARRILEDLGFDVCEAADGHDALARCAHAMPDVILLDWIMPHMNGPAFLTALRSMPGGDRPKVVFCTSRTQPWAIARALMAGADEFIMKPFDAQILASKLEQIGVIAIDHAGASDDSSGSLLCRRD